MAAYTGLYSPIREFVGNVVKRAPASSVVVTLHRFEATAVVTVVDNGVGLDPGVLASRLARGHIGLNARRFRLEAAGGVLQCELAIYLVLAQVS